MSCLKIAEDQGLSKIAINLSLHDFLQLPSTVFYYSHCLNVHSLSIQSDSLRSNLNSYSQQTNQKKISSKLHFIRTCHDKHISIVFIEKQLSQAASCCLVKSSLFFSADQQTLSFVFQCGRAVKFRVFIGKIDLYIIQYYMSSYKQKIQKELKRAVTRFEKQRSHPFKTHPIQKNQKLQQSKPKNKRLFRPVTNYYQKGLIQNYQHQQTLFNFYNIITIDEAALNDANASASYIRNVFYTKITRKIEVREDYLVFQLTDSCILPSSVSQTLERYRNSSNQKLRNISFLLQSLQEKLSFKGIEATSDVSITQQAYKMFDSLGKTMFISKIAWQKLVISKSLLQLCEQDVNQFIFQSLISKIPKIQGPRCISYYQILCKQIENYSKILDFLQGTIPLTSLVEFSKMKYLDYIVGRTNMQHQCAMSLSMPIPLVQLITIDNVLYSRQSRQESDNGVRQQLRRLRGEFDKKAHSTLQYLIDLPQNRLPVNECKVATYTEKVQLPCSKLQESETKMIDKSVNQSEGCKSPTLDYQF